MSPAMIFAAMSASWRVFTSGPKVRNRVRPSSRNAISQCPEARCLTCGILAVLLAEHPNTVVRFRPQLIALRLVAAPGLEPGTLGL